MFSGIGVLGLGLLMQWLRRRSRSSPQSASITAQGAKVTDSPVASGTGIVQTVNSPTINVSLPAPQPPEQQVPVGTYLQERIVQKTREAANRQNDAGLVSMWPEVVREVMAKYPKLSSAEKASLRGNIEGQIQLLSVRTGIAIHMFTGALDEVARILGTR